MRRVTSVCIRRKEVFQISVVDANKYMSYMISCSFRMEVGKCCEIALYCRCILLWIQVYRILRVCTYVLNAQYN